jgi:hypothetical protein
LIYNNNKKEILLELGCTGDTQYSDIITIIRLNMPALCGLFIVC